MRKSFIIIVSSYDQMYMSWFNKLKNCIKYLGLNNKLFYIYFIYFSQCKRDSYVMCVGGCIVIKLLWIMISLLLHHSNLIATRGDVICVVSCTTRVCCVGFNSTLYRLCKLSKLKEELFSYYLILIQIN